MEKNGCQDVSHLYLSYFVFMQFFVDPGGLLHPKKIFVRSILVTFVRSLRIICIAMSMAALEKASPGV